jgi:hypothetical protein
MARYQSSRRKQSPQSSPKANSDALRSRPFAPAPESPESIPGGPTQDSQPAEFAVVEPGGVRSQPVQAKLTIGTPGDKYEQEADRVATQVVQQINAPAPNQPQSVQRDTVQRDSLPEEEELQMKPLLQRDSLPEEEELQMRPAPSTEIVVGDAAPELETAIHQARGRGQALAPNLQAQMGQAMGADFSGVKIHTDSQSDQLNRSIQAKAFTTGQDIFFRQGAYQPGSSGGQELIAHELTHVVQQGAGSRLQRYEIAQYAGEVEMGQITTLAEIKRAIEDYLDQTHSEGIGALFRSGGLISDDDKWGEFLFNWLSETNEIEGFEEEDFADVVRTIKAKHRKEEFLRVTEFYGWLSDESSLDYPWRITEFHDLLKSVGMRIEEEDEKVVSDIYDKKGNREELGDESATAFKIGSETYHLDEKELKEKLDTELGVDVNWGHEISYCMGDTGKKGIMYYVNVAGGKKPGQALREVGTTGQSHASSKNGRTIIWEENSGTIEIKAIGKHTDRADSRLSKGASYVIEKSFCEAYNGYVNKIVGFKS